MGIFDDPRGREAEELSFQAERAGRRGDLSTAQELYARAAALETAVARSVPHDAPRIRSVLGVSAAAMWLKAGRYLETAEIAQEFMRDPCVTEDGRTELAELLARSRSELARHRQERYEGLAQRMGRWMTDRAGGCVMKLMLDTGILACLCHPRNHRDVQTWFRALLMRRPEPPDLLVSVLAYYELRRKLSQAGATASLTQLDDLAQSLTYVPVTMNAARKASELWARLRSNDPMNVHRLSDADVLMAAQAALEEAVLVSSDLGSDLLPEVTVKDWKEIAAA